jgi:hypothetical protein
MKHIKKFEESFSKEVDMDGRPPNYTNIYPTYIPEVSISNLGIHLIDGMMTSRYI